MIGFKVISGTRIVQFCRRETRNTRAVSLSFYWGAVKGVTLSIYSEDPADANKAASTHLALAAIHMADFKSCPFLFYAKG